MRKSVFANPSEAREAYLEQIGARLRLRLSAFELHDSIQEMRAHIDATAAAYEELGLDPKAAMSAALERFGEADHIADGVASVCVPRPAVGIARAIVFAVASEVILGGLLMVAVELLLTSFSLENPARFSMDLMIGGTFGFVIGLVAWMAPFKPKQYAMVVCAMLNLLLAYTLYRTYWMLGKPLMAVEIGIYCTLTVYYLGWNGARMARRAAARVSDDLPGPMKRA